MIINDNNKTVLGVDLGGTNIRVGRVENGELTKKNSSLVPKDVENPQFVINTLINSIEEVYDNDVVSIGLGIPSLVDRKNGIVYDVQNIPSWKKIYLKDILENHFDAHVVLDNDANCFAIGERLFGKGKDSKNFVGLSIGTGIGAGIISNGKLFDDANCGSGEFGMLPYLDTIYEDYCSGKFFMNQYGINGVDLYNNALNNDKKAIKIFNEFGMHLGNIIKAIMFTVDPEKIIIGGSISNAHNFYEESILKQLASFPYSNAKQNIIIEFSDLDNPALLGAAALCFNHNN